MKLCLPNTHHRTSSVNTRFLLLSSGHFRQHAAAERPLLSRECKPTVSGPVVNAHNNPGGWALAPSDTLQRLLQEIPLSVLSPSFVPPDKVVQGYTIHRCGLGCRPQLHYHCIYCQSMLSRKPDFIRHLSFCKNRHPPLPPITQSSVTTTTTIPAPTSPCEQLVIQRKCPICKLVLNKKNVKRHIERMHTDRPRVSKVKSHLRSDCIDPENGVCTAHKSASSSSSLVHVQSEECRENQHVSCGSTECQDNMQSASSSGLEENECNRLKSIKYFTSYASCSELQEPTLTEMVNRKWFGEDKKKICLEWQKLSLSSDTPLSLQCKTEDPQSKRYISVYDPTVSHQSKLGRVMVSYDTKNKLWHCPCTKMEKLCPHKCVAKWHLFQTQCELFREDMSPVTSTEDSDSETSLFDAPHSLKDNQNLRSMVHYILEYKKLPDVLPDHLRLPSAGKQYPRHLVPEERLCQLCPGEVFLSDPVLITQKARILTTSCIVQDVSTYCKSCRQCGNQYRYQEWRDGVHNFNNHILLDLPLCVTIRNLLKIHTAVNRVVEYLELSTGEEFPSADTLLHAYLHFEALTDHDHQDSCVLMERIAQGFVTSSARPDKSISDAVRYDVVML
ncbi:hypothetical protein INR49_028722 [Caranx melampygus]|nr:hypothetical protein INR49_028722 [Caranx melampygus]